MHSIHGPSESWKRYGNHFVIEDAPDSELPDEMMTRRRRCG